MFDFFCPTYLSILCCETLLSVTSVWLVHSSSLAVPSSCSYTLACCSFMSRRTSSCFDKYCGTNTHMHNKYCIFTQTCSYVEFFSSMFELRLWGNIWAFLLLPRLNLLASLCNSYLDLLHLFFISDVHLLQGVLQLLVPLQQSLSELSRQVQI